MKAIRYWGTDDHPVGGYLTVFLSLSLTIILSLFFTLIEGARINAVRMRSECVVDIAADACLAEFNKALLDKYDLFFIDTGYGTGSPGLDKTVSHMRDYMNHNFTASSIFGLTMKRSFQNISIEECSISDARFAADDHAAALREQVYAYMSAEPLGKAAADILGIVDKYNGIGLDLTVWDRKKAEYEAELEGQTAPSKDDGSETQVNDPGAAIDNYRFMPALSQAVEDSGSLSNAAVSVSGLLSHRVIHTGSGLKADNSHHYKEADALLFDQYIFEKCSRYMRESDDGKLKYEAEYILYGQNSDRKNLEKLAEKLLLIRSCANLAYLMTDEAKQEEARLLAFVVSIVLLTPELEEILQKAIIVAWSYLEAVQDVKTLFAGGRVPLVKSHDTWKTNVLGILTPGLATHGEKGGSGFGYDDYLRVFMYLLNSDTKNYRLMDVMEMNVRKAEGSENFKMDWCMDTFTVNASMKSSSGYTCRMQQTFSYQ